ncbi:MAG: MBL fold metallo-hydrolase [Candidatus Pollutiaquabacter aromativorans]
MSAERKTSRIHCLTVNPFQENTYVVAAPNGECVILDPGCYDAREEQALERLIERESLRPVRLLNTHAHLDHILGNAFVAERWNLKPELHRADHDLLRAAPVYSEAWGIRLTPSPNPGAFLEEGDRIVFGGVEFRVLFTPGHCPGHVVLYNEAEGYVIGGDVLFQRSIGRTDLPGGRSRAIAEQHPGKALHPARRDGGLAGAWTGDDGWGGTCGESVFVRVRCGLALVGRASIFVLRRF